MNPNSSGEGQRPAEAMPQNPAETGAGQAIEKTPAASPENSAQKALQASRQAVDGAALPGQAIKVGDDDTVVSDDTAMVSSSTATDSDRIEKVWIDKAKAVAAQTQDDPYEQKNAM